MKEYTITNRYKKKRNCNKNIGLNQLFFIFNLTFINYSQNMNNFGHTNNKIIFKIKYTTY